jgi:monoamine oxidase
VAEGLGAVIARWGAKVPVKLATRVVRVDSTGTLVQIVTTGGELNARAVIVTVPTGVLAAGPFGFAPQLKAAKLEAIVQLPMALYNKVAISFARKVIDAPAGRGVSGLTRKGQAFDAVVRPYNRDAAVVFVGGAQARELEEQGGSAAVTFALSAMAEIYGDELRGLVAHSFATRWGKDPFARGSWSMAIPGRAEARLVLAQPHHDRVFFAGEATDPVWATRVGGAYASGLRAAGEALAVLGSRR